MRNLFRSPLLALALVACSGSGADQASDDLTSLTAVERGISFEGSFYAAAEASDADLLKVAQRQAQTALGPLHEVKISVASRMLSGIETGNIIKTPVTLVKADGTRSDLIKVAYRYLDQAVVPHTLGDRSAISLGLLMGDYQAQGKRVLEECTGNGEHEQHFKDQLWYVFNPSLEKCQKVMAAEQTAIADERTTLGLVEGEVGEAEAGRLYLPMTARLAPAEDAGETYPEYDRLWAGGIEKDVLSFALLDGDIDHPVPGQEYHIYNDAGYIEMLGQMDTILYARPNMKMVSNENGVDLQSFTIGEKTVKAADFRDILAWERGEQLGELSDEEVAQLREYVSYMIHRNWIRFEEVVPVSVNGEPTRNVTVRVNLYFGTSSVDSQPFRTAFRTSDVVLYNGHSVVGTGPLDPTKFTDEDFPESYQVLFIDSCVSFNYYNRDYFTKKEQGTRDLETITNGLESFSDGSGPALGRFVTAILEGTPSYRSLLETAATQGEGYEWGQDALRVVDGELDNVYSPSQTPIRFE